MMSPLYRLLFQITGSPPEAPAEGEKAVQLPWAKLSQVSTVKILSFGFLQADDVTCTFNNFITNSIQFPLRINAPNILG